MKKALLLSIVSLVGASAFAQTDITPSGYVFANLDEFKYHERVYGTANLANPCWTTVDGENQFDNGLAVILGNLNAFGPSNSTWTNIDECTGGASVKAGTSIVDLGGEIGKVLCVSGVNSNINSTIESLYGVNPAIASMTNNPGWFNVEFFPNPDDITANGSKADFHNIKIRMVMNVYTNQMLDGTEMLEIIPRTNDGNNPCTSFIMKTDYTLLVNDEGDPIDYDGEYVSGDEGCWDPTKWVVYEQSFWVQPEDNGTTYNPFNLKIGFKADALATGTLFIKELSFFTVESGEGFSTGDSNTTYDLSVETLEPAFGDAPAADYPTIYLMGSCNAWPSTADPADSTDGVYSWTGIVMPDATSYFAFTESDSTEWSEINAVRYAPANSNEPVVLGEAMEVSYGVDASWAIEAGTYDLVLDVNNLTLTVTGNSGLEMVTFDEAAPSVYYNLQGVEVANPERGVFIRVQGDKVAKVML